jgi:hypothetical protein
MVVAWIGYLLIVHCRVVVVKRWSNFVASMPSLQLWYLVIVDWGFFHSFLRQLQFRNVV